MQEKYVEEVTLAVAALSGHEIFDKIKQKDAESYFDERVIPTLYKLVNDVHEKEKRR